jgi:hypothetical protein
VDPHEQQLADFGHLAFAQSAGTSVSLASTDVNTTGAIRQVRSMVADVRTKSEPVKDEKAGSG